MTSENQALLDAIRTVVKEEIAPLSQKIDVLGEIDKLQTGQRTQQKRIKALEDQVASLQRRLENLESSRN